MERAVKQNRVPLEGSFKGYYKGTVRDTVRVLYGT